MNKKAGLLIVTLVVLLSLLLPGLTEAQGGLTVSSNTAVIQFPMSIQFNLTASSSVNITDIRLRYKVDKDSFADIVSEGFVQFTPASTVKTSWTLDMLKVGGLPPGAAIKYWWVVKDAAGSTTESQSATIKFDDNRYKWNNQNKDMIILRWYEGNQSFVNELMGAADAALNRLANDTGAVPDKPIDIYIYATQQDLLGAMVHPQEWTGGVKFTGYSIIAIAIGQSELAWGKEAMSHELTHLVVEQMTRNPYSGMPTWLDEGLAVYGEGNEGSNYIPFLNQAIAQKKFLSIRSLASPFSSIPEQAYLSYAQSYSVVDYLISQYGQSKMSQLLETFSHGNTYDGALQQVYGFNMDGLNTRWQEYVLGSAATTQKKLTVEWPMTEPVFR